MKVACLTEFQCAIYADGELPAREASEVSQHLELCFSCRKSVDLLREENRVLVECLQTMDFIEFELEDEVLSAAQAESLGVVRFTAMVLALSVLLRPVFTVLEQLGLTINLSGLAVAAAYIIPAGITLIDSIWSN